MSEGISWAVKNGDLEEIKKYTSENCIKFDDPVSNGRPMICVAADYGHRHVIEYLIENGAKVNIVDKFGMTPLLSAIFEGHTSCVELLLQKGADKNGKAPDGNSYIDCAEKEEIKKLLK